MRRLLWCGCGMLARNCSKIFQIVRSQFHNRFQFLLFCVLTRCPFLVTYLSLFLCPQLLSQNVTYNVSFLDAFCNNCSIFNLIKTVGDIGIVPNVSWPKCVLWNLCYQTSKPEETHLFNLFGLRMAIIFFTQQQQRQHLLPRLIV